MDERRMTKPILILVNGHPKSGKDTVILQTQRLLKERRVPSIHLSSINPIREMVMSAGIIISLKTEADRKLLSIIGEAVEEHSRFRSTWCSAQIQKFLRAHGGEPRAVAFLQIREPHVQENLCAILRTNQPDTTVIRLGVLSNRSTPVLSNPSDAGIAQLKFDHTIQNDGTTDELREACRAFLRRISLLP
jgi:hypothetical protein